MSGRTKVFAELDAQVRADSEETQRREDEREAGERALNESFMLAAGSYEPEFRKLVVELRADHLGANLRTNVRESVQVKDPGTLSAINGELLLALTFEAGDQGYELGYVTQRDPPLGMLAWRRRTQSVYMIGQQSKTHPGQVEARLVEHHVKVAWDAMESDAAQFKRR